MTPDTYLFGSRGFTLVLYTAAVMLVLLLLYWLIRMMLGKFMTRFGFISWITATALTAFCELLYSEGDFWHHNNGMAGVWMYLLLPFLGGTVWIFLNLLHEWRHSS